MKILDARIVNSIRLIIKSEHREIIMADLPVVPNVGDLIAPFEEDNDLFEITSRSFLRNSDIPGGWDVVCIGIQR